MAIAIKDILKKIVLIILALQILNQSFDAIEFRPLVASTDINNIIDINSATEYFAEIVMGYRDLFPDFERHAGHKHSASIKHISIKLFEPLAFIVPTVIEYQTASSKTYPITNEDYSFLFSKK